MDVLRRPSQPDEPMKGFAYGFSQSDAGLAGWEDRNSRAPTALGKAKRTFTVSSCNESNSCGSQNKLFALASPADRRRQIHLLHPTSSGKARTRSETTTGRTRRDRGLDIKFCDYLILDCGTC